MRNRIRQGFEIEGRPSVQAGSNLETVQSDQPFWILVLSLRDVN